MSGNCSDTFQESLQLSTANRMLQFTNSFGFNLSYAFAGNLEDSAHFLQGVGIAVTQTISQLDDLSLTVRKCLQDSVNFVLEHFGSRIADRAVIATVFNKVTEGIVLTITDGLVEADRLS